MLQQFDTVIVLSQKTNRNGILADRTRERTEKGIEIFKDGIVKTITLSGGYERLVDLEIPTHAEAMKKFAIEKGVPESKIIIEEKSLDTVGQAIFTKRYLAIPQKWKKIIVISSDYHIERVRAIFEFVYGKNFKISFVTTPTEGDRTKIRAKEKESLQSFYETFKDVNPWDDKKIFETLFAKHPYYKNLQSDKF